jgi:hypothetical protein
LFSEVQRSWGNAFCSDDLTFKKATVAKAQQLPQLPWFLTGVTFPLVLQSNVARISPTKTVWEVAWVPDVVELYALFFSAASYFFEV